jgi:hypothetical protein
VLLWLLLKIQNTIFSNLSVLKSFEMVVVMMMWGLGD